MDELPGCSEIEKAGRIGEYLRQYKENGTAGRVEEKIALMVWIVGTGVERGLLFVIGYGIISTNTDRQIGI